MAKRITITFDDEQYEAIKLVKGMGARDADRIRNLVLAYLSEHSYIKDYSRAKSTEDSQH